MVIGVAGPAHSSATRPSHRASAPRRTISLRCSAVGFVARAWPPFEARTWQAISASAGKSPVASRTIWKVVGVIEAVGRALLFGLFSGDGVAYASPRAGNLRHDVVVVVPFLPSIAGRRVRPA